MNVAIVGGGIMGITLAHYLAKQGVRVDVFEASPTLGGLAGPMVLPDGVEVDRFYHAVLPSDDHLLDLCADVGIADQLRYSVTKAGFFKAGQVHSMNNLAEFLTFPPLKPVDRVRLGWTVWNAQRVRDWRELEGIRVADWLRRLGGSGPYEAIWRPMLNAKFDGAFGDVPATWMWSRLVRVKSSRTGAQQKELAGHIVGGYVTLIRAMVAHIERLGGSVNLRCPVQEVVIEDAADGKRATGVRVDGELRPCDAVAVTSQVPIFRKLIPNAGAAYHDFLGKTEYLGIVCPLLVLDRPLSGYWTLNITDERFPFTGVIETTTYINPSLVGGHHLVYVPKYTAPGSAWLSKSDDEIRAIWLDNLKRMFPSFDERSVRYFLVHRERYVEPLHPLNSTHLIPSCETPIRGLYLATTAQIYPALTNGESVSRHAHASAKVIADAAAPSIARRAQRQWEAQPT